MVECWDSVEWGILGLGQWMSQVLGALGIQGEKKWQIRGLHFMGLVKW